MHFLESTEKSVQLIEKIQSKFRGFEKEITDYTRSRYAPLRSYLINYEKKA